MNCILIFSRNWEISLDVSVAADLVADETVCAEFVVVWSNCKMVGAGPCVIEFIFFGNLQLVIDVFDEVSDLWVSNWHSSDSDLSDWF